jgi:hypothetical protein
MSGAAAAKRLASYALLDAIRPFGPGEPTILSLSMPDESQTEFHPLANWLGDHTSPELQYLEARFAALLSYGVSARILGCVLPLQHATSITTWKRQVARVGARLDEEAHHRHSSQPALNEFGLPKRNPLRAVGIDGGYVKASDAPSRQEGWFEVMVGKSLPRAGNGQVFAFVHRLEPKPNERMNDSWPNRAYFPRSPRRFSPMVVRQSAKHKVNSGNLVNRFSTGSMWPCERPS